MILIQGKGVSNGVAIGPLYFYQRAKATITRYEVEDAELSEEITMDVIQTEYAETSLASRLLAELMDNSTELQMAYDLLKECRE